MKRKIALLLVLTFTTLAANAEGMVYDPTEFQPSIIKLDDVDSKIKSAVDNNTNKAIETKTQESANYAQNSLSGQSTNFNNALYELDNAQVSIRNELLEYQSKYQEVDTQYKLIKEQRRVLSQQIREINRKVNAIEKSKKQIRKTMN